MRVRLVCGRWRVRSSLPATILHPQHLCRRVYSFRLSVHPLVCLFVCSFVHSYFLPVRGITSKLYVQATWVEYISPTTHQTAFIRVATLMQKQNSLTFHRLFPHQIQFFTDQNTAVLRPICLLTADKWQIPFTSSLNCTSLILQMKQIKSLKVK